MSEIFIVWRTGSHFIFKIDFLIHFAHGVNLALLTVMLTLPSGEEEAILRMFSWSLGSVAYCASS